MASFPVPLLPLSILLFSSSLMCFVSASQSLSLSISSSSTHRRLLQSSPPPSPPSRQNIQTFFPSLPSPAFPNLRPPNPPPPPPPPPPSGNSPPPKSSGSTKDVTIAVVATAASSFAVSGLLFFCFQRLSKKQRQLPAAAAKPGKRGQLDGLRSSKKSLSLKGVIVDENGLDAIYWREFNQGTRRRCRHCDRALENSGQVEDGSDQGEGAQEEEEEEDRRRASTARWRRRQERKAQGRPLLPSGSVNSTSGIFQESSSSTDRSSSSAFTVFAGDTAAQPPLPLPPGRSPPVPQPPPRPSPASTSTPPPPPPPPGPPPAVKVNSTPPPPPPPRPPPASKNSAPASPPPPPRGGSAAAVPAARPPPPPAAAAGEGGPRAKLKPLHWDKVNPANTEHSMVWDKISNGSFSLDENIMEALFGTVATARRSPRTADNPSSRPSASASNSAGTSTQICLLDQRKSQNIAIVLRSLDLSRQEILAALLDGHGLGVDNLEKLSRLAPTREEETIIREYTGNPSRLADAESFLFHLLRAVPAPFARVDALLFKSNYGPEVAHLKSSLQALELACRELKTRGLFLKLLEAVLKAGNRMNAGTARGNAQAFNLTALRKLSDVKSTDGSTTLLHFVVEEVVRSQGKLLVTSGRSQSLRRSGSGIVSSERGGILERAASRRGREEREKEYMRLGLPVVGGLSEQLAHVKKAAAVDYDALVGACPSLGTKLNEVRRFLDSCGSGGFVREMRVFVDAAATELAAVRVELSRVLELVRKTTEYYQPGASKDRGAHPLQLFIIVKDFLGTVDQACVDIARNLQKKKPAPAATATAASGSSTSPERGRRVTVRFPNLPARFLSDGSKSDSSSDEDER